MNRFFTIAIFLIACILFTACEKRPKGIIAKGDMTDVLYDYHLAQAILGQEGNGKDGEYKNLMDAVLAKHNITQAEFDSSIVWYNVHAEDLEDIYKKLEERFNARAEEMKLTTGDNEMAAIITENGDTTNLWNGPKVILLRNQDIMAIEKFSYKADTSFRNNDRFLLRANVTFLGAADVYENHSLTAALTIHDKAGGTFSDVVSLGSNSNIRLDISSAEKKPMKTVSGSFYFQNEPNSKTLCIISNIELIRMRQKTAEEETDTLQNTEPDRQDSIHNDTPAIKVHSVRKSPEQIRQETTKGKQHIQIKTAPEVNKNVHSRPLMKRRDTRKIHN